MVKELKAKTLTLLFLHLAKTSNNESKHGGRGIPWIYTFMHVALFLRPRLQ
jgi:hypothetical protein